MKSLELETTPPTHRSLTDSEYENKLSISRTRRKAMQKMMMNIRKDLQNKGLTTGAAKIYKGRDIHCFFSLPENPNRIIHFQLYSSRQNLTTVDIRIREMDPTKIPEARKLVSVGNEETAVTRSILGRVPVLYTQNSITRVLEQTLQMSSLVDKKTS